jgi:hypothetical protein
MVAALPVRLRAQARAGPAHRPGLMADAVEPSD